MRRRRLYIVLLASLLLGVLAFIRFFPSPEPSYQGRKLSSWLETQFSLSGSPESRTQQLTTFSNAICQMGTNSVPYLLKSMQYEIPPWKRSLNQFIRTKLPRQVSWRLERILNRENDRAYNTVQAFEVLGPRAEAAAASLVQMLSSTNPAITYRATAALGAVGPTGLSPLLNTLTNGQARGRDFAAGALARLGTNALPAVSALIQSLQDNNQPLACAAAWSLGQLKLQPHLVLPALQASIKDSRSRVRYSTILALKEFGTNARPALPAIQESLNDSDRMVRNAATNAFRKIAPDLHSREGTNAFSLE